jgi:hypothetical protein
MKTYWVSEGVAPRILNLGTRLEVSGQLHAPASLSPSKEPPVSIRPQSWSGRGDEKNPIIAPARN